MKELSIEEKAKRYDEAIEIAMKFLNKELFAENSEWAIKHIFPELKESEDERIRKGIIRNLEYLMDRAEGFVKDELKERIAWLERQVPVYLSHDDEIMIRQLTEYFTTGKGLQNTNDTVVEWLEDVKRKLEKQGEQKSVDEIKPKFKHGDRVRNKKSGLEQTLGSCIEDVYEGAFPFPIKDQDDWELVEQKLTDKIQIGKEYKCIASPRYSTFMRGEIYKPEDKFLCSFMNFCSDCFEPIEDSEQSDFTSNANKVEPKFKIVDKIIEKDFDECDCGTIIEYI